MMRFPSRRPTPSEYSVLVIAAAAALILFGVVAIVLSLRAGPAQAELAATVFRRGLLAMGMGFALLTGYWLHRRWTG
jgi:hypothetical protein